MKPLEMHDILETFHWILSETQNTTTTLFDFDKDRNFVTQWEMLISVMEMLEWKYLSHAFCFL